MKDDLKGKNLNLETDDMADYDCLCNIDRYLPSHAIQEVITITI